VTDQALIDELYRSRRNSEPFSLHGVTLSLDDGLETQLRVAQRFEADGERVGGWKVGMTSGRSHDRMGEGFRPHGYVLASNILASGARYALDERLNPLLEPELCLILGEPLSGSPSAEEARAAVAGVAAAFELVELRLPGGGQADDGLLVADGLANWGIVVGEPVSPPSWLPEGLTVRLLCDDEEVAHAQAGESMVFDNPFLSLARLAQALARTGRRLEAGQPVITGSFANVGLDRPARWRAEFSDVGVVELDVV
jgi:2-keto-4-pentenoate hydratase